MGVLQQNRQLSGRVAMAPRGPGLTRFGHAASPLFDHLLGASNCEKVPLAWHAFESVKTPVFETDAGADDSRRQLAASLRLVERCRKKRREFTVIQPLERVRQILRQQIPAQGSGHVDRRLRRGHLVCRRWGALGPMPLRTDLVSGAECDRVTWSHHAATEAMGQGEERGPRRPRTHRKAAWTTPLRGRLGSSQRGLAARANRVSGRGLHRAPGNGFRTLETKGPNPLPNGLRFPQRPRTSHYTRPKPRKIEGVPRRRGTRG